jgi:hypothetical protein
VWAMATATENLPGSENRACRETPAELGSQVPRRTEVGGAQRKAEAHAADGRPGKSDSRVVPKKVPNKAGTSAEGLEGRRLAKRSATGHHAPDAGTGARASGTGANY